MASVVVTGATCMCGFGTAPFTLVGTNTPTLLVDGKPALSSGDCAIGTNVVQTPGCMCSSMANPAVASATAAAMMVLTPQPCTPVFTGWTGSNGKLLSKGAVVTSECTLGCAYGCLTIQNAGQTKVLT